jgi:hypothetical protein
MLINGRFGQEQEINEWPRASLAKHVRNATTVMEAYYGVAGTPTWQALASNRLAFTNTLGVAATPTTIDSLPINTFQGGTHVASGTPTDVCTNPHTPNFKYLTSTTWSINGAASAAVSDGAVSATQASFRWHFNDGSSRVIQNVRMYCYDNSVIATFAPAVDVAMFVSGNSMSAWFVLNDATAVGPTGFTTGNIGGDNTSERISGAGMDRTTAADQYWYVAVSAAAESAGLKTSFAFGIYLEYV